MNTEHKENNLDLTIMRDTLLPAVKDAASAVSKRSTLPVLGNVKLAATEDSLTISGTDLNVFVERTVWPKEVIPGAITVNAKALLDALKAAPKGTLVSLTAIEGNKLVLTTSSRQGHAQRHSRRRVPRQHVLPRRRAHHGGGRRCPQASDRRGRVRCCG